jgi:hypothetical protein
LDQFHKRWFSKDVGDWLDKIRQVDVSFDAVEHRIHVSLLRMKSKVLPDERVEAD